MAARYWRKQREGPTVVGANPPCVEGVNPPCATGPGHATSPVAGCDRAREEKLKLGQELSAAPIWSSRGVYSRAWWAQNSSSPPVRSMALTWAAALQRSQRSRRVSTGDGTVDVVMAITLLPGWRGPKG